MAAMSTEEFARINDLRQRILNKETIQPDELNAAITSLRNARSARSAASLKADVDAAKDKKPKKAKAVVTPMTMEDLTALFAKKAAAPKPQ